MNKIQIEIFLGTIFLAITGIILIIVGINEEDRMAEFAKYQEAQSIEEGAELFEINCRGCHGPQAEGIIGLAPPLSDAHFFNERLAEVGWQGSLEDYIVATVSTGRQVSTRPDQYPGAGSPAMPTWSDQFGGPLRTDQIEAIAQFILNFESSASGDYQAAELSTPTPSGAEVDDPVARGLAIFNNNGCGGCHTIQGISVGTVGPDLTKIGETAATRVDGLSAEEYIHESIINPSAYLVEGYDDLMVKTFGDTISDQDLNDLIAFLLSQQ